MMLKDISFKRPEENILFDDVLLACAESGEGGECLRLWESSETFVVLGRVGKAQEDLNIANIRADGVRVLRRSSGGGTVVQGPGCLNYSLILSKLATPEVADLKKSYRFILGRIVEALRGVGIEAAFQGTSDLALVQTQKKFSGNAQKRGRTFILHHGTLLYDFDLALIERYLRVPKDVPAYRRGRRHMEFVTNLGRPEAELKLIVAKAFSANKSAEKATGAEIEKLAAVWTKRNPAVSL